MDRKKGDPPDDFDFALGEDPVGVRFKIIAVSVRGAFAIMHEMDAVRDKRGATALLRLHKVADRVQMRESPEWLFRARATREDDRTANAAEIRIEAKAAAVESAIGREQPVQHGNAHRACGG